MSNNNDYDAQGRRVYGRLDDNNSNTNDSYGNNNSNNSNNNNAYNRRDDNSYDNSGSAYHRRDDYRNDQPRTYTMLQRLYQAGEDYNIQDERGQRMFYVDGKRLNAEGILYFFDDGGSEQYRIHYQNNRGNDYVEVEDSRGNVAATIRRASQGPRDHFEVQMDRGGDLLIEGNLNAPDYRISEAARNGRDIATVSSNSRRDNEYEVSIDGHEDDALLLALTVAVDILAHAG